MELQLFGNNLMKSFLMLKSELLNLLKLSFTKLR